MKQLRFGVKAGLAALMLLALSGADARSGTIISRFDGFNPTPSYLVTRSLRNPYLTGTTFTTTQVQTGRFTLTRQGGTAPETLVGTTPPQFFAFCIEPLETISPGSTYTHDLVTLDLVTNNIGGLGSAKADLVRELFGRHFPDFSAPVTAQKAGALGVALWEIVRENPTNALNVYSGDAYFSGTESIPGTLSLAQTFLSTIDGTGTKLSNLYGLTRNGVQDLVVQAVPEPSTLCLGLIGGFVGLGALYRRSRRS